MNDLALGAADAHQTLFVAVLMISSLLNIAYLMPIAIRVVSEEQYDNWVELAIEDMDAANEQLAQAIEKDKALAAARDARETAALEDALQPN